MHALEQLDCGRQRVLKERRSAVVSDQHAFLGIHYTADLVAPVAIGFQPPLFVLAADLGDHGRVKVVQRRKLIVGQVSERLVV